MLMRFAMSEWRHGWRRGLITLTAVLPLVAFWPRAAASEFLSFIRDTEIEALLNDYTRPLFRAAGFGGGTARMRIVKHEAFNAFVVDNRHVYIHTGALQTSDTPNQIIGVLAHEIAHIAKQHLPELRNQILRDPTRGVLTQFLFVGITLRDRRRQELEADQTALGYLHATRQSALGMIQVFERFAEDERFTLQRTPQSLFARTHPFASDRIAQLRPRAQASPFHNTKDPPELQLRHDMMRAKIAGYLDSPQITFNRYPARDTSLPARYARTLATYFGSGIERALPMIDALVKEHPRNPYFHEVRADFLMRSGRAREAIPALRQAVQLAGDAPLIRVRLAQALISADDRNVDEAIALARRALTNDPNPQAWRLIANAHYKKGELPQADLATAEALFLEGDVKQSQIFARRAQAKLRNGSPEWIRAGDIVNFKLPS